MREDGYSHRDEMALNKLRRNKERLEHEAQTTEQRLNKGLAALIRENDEIRHKISQDCYQLKENPDMDEARRRLKAGASANRGGSNGGFDSSITGLEPKVWDRD